MKTITFLCFFFFVFQYKVNAQSPETNSKIQILDSLMVAASDWRDFDAAIIYSTELANLIESVNGKIDSNYAHAIIYRAKALTGKGEFENAFPLYDEGLSILEQTTGKETRFYVIALYMKAEHFAYRGKFEKSKAAAERAVEKAEQVLDDMDIYYIHCINLLGAMYKELELYDEAELLYKKGIDLLIKSRGKEHILYGNMLENLANLYWDTDRLEETQALLQDVEIVYSKAVGKEDPAYAFLLSSYGIVSLDLGNLKKAKQYFTQSLEILQKTIGVSDPNYYIIVENLSDVYWDMKNYSEARKHQDYALELVAKIYGTDDRDYLDLLNKKSQLLKIMGDYDQAMKCAHIVLEAADSKISKKESIGISLCNNIADIHFLNNRLDESISWTIEAINRCCVSNNKLTDYTELKSFLLTNSFSFNPGLTAAIHGLSQIFEKKYTNSNEIEYLQQAYLFIDALLAYQDNHRKSFDFEHDKLRIQKLVYKYSGLGLQVSHKLYKKTKDNQAAFNAFALMERNKAALLSDALKAHKEYNFGNIPDSLRQQELALQEKIFSFKKQILEETDSTIVSEAKKELSATNRAITEFKDALEKKYPEYINFKYKQQQVLAQEIQKTLRKEEAIIQYYLHDSALYSFVLTQDDIQFIREDINNKKFKSQAKLLRKNLSNYSYIVKNQKKTITDFSTSAYYFYKKCLQNQLKNIPEHINHLIIVPDNILNDLPFETFLTKSGSQKGFDELAYLINDYQISYSYSANLLKESYQRENKINNKKVLLLGATYPEKGEKNESTIIRSARCNRLRQQLGPLPAVNSELESIAKLTGGISLYGKGANERYFKNNAANFQIIHLAMHGLLDKQHPILSSLVFTENGDTIEDNFLQTHEISRMKLNAELVVLSACETGYGKFEKGEGVMSLARSFMYAGVPSLIVSLWQVNDNSTAIIMQNFYKKLSKGLSKSEALRQAKLSYMSHAKGITAHPAFWSPFIQLGDSRPITFSSKKGWLLWGIGICAVVLVLVVLGRRKQTKIA